CGIEHEGHRLHTDGFLIGTDVKYKFATWLDLPGDAIVLARQGVRTAPPRINLHCKRDRVGQRSLKVQSLNGERFQEYGRFPRAVGQGDCRPGGVGLGKHSRDGGGTGSRIHREDLYSLLVCSRVHDESSSHRDLPGNTWTRYRDLGGTLSFTHRDSL